MDDWIPTDISANRPRYLALADCIEGDIQNGRLIAGDRLPTQRRLAQRLGVDFTTVARGYAEAQRRGLIESRGSQGTFIRATKISAKDTAVSLPPQDTIDVLMNAPPEPDDPELIGRMGAELAGLEKQLIPLLRYQPFGGTSVDKMAASAWVGRRGIRPSFDQLFITSGAQPAFFGILNVLTKPGQSILCDELTYAGFLSSAAHLGLVPVGLAYDENGILPDALERAYNKTSSKVLYLNPTLQNPTTITMPLDRREQIVRIARKLGLIIIEDDPYSFHLPSAPVPFAVLAPELTWYITSLSKSLGAGLRVAYVVCPNVQLGWEFAAAVRCVTVMASSVTINLATRWIQGGIADDILRFIQNESEIRQEIAQQTLSPNTFQADPYGFHIWLHLRNGWSRSSFTGHMRPTKLTVVPSDAFSTTESPPPEAVRISLGGPLTRTDIRSALEYAAIALKQRPAMTSAFL